MQAIQINADGSQETVEAPQDFVEKVEAQREQLAREEIAQSAARKRLNELKKQRGESKPLEVKVNDETFFIKRFSYNEVKEVALSLYRDGFDVLQLQDEDGVTAVTEAVLKAGVVTQSGGEFFTVEDLQDYFSDPHEIDVVSELFQAVLELNPTILGSLKKKA